ncbi:transposase [Luteolibacter sp. Populi]|uniref:transposase n=1 Tax=Luteolibacter sp. Populi TaxID=3230487 RepID=UPI003467143A
MDDRDRDTHEGLVAGVVQRTGWEIFAWVLLKDHYHMVLRTPEANLVTGMKWFQNFWTKRFNARHERSGSVFGGRYKSVLVQGDGHLSSIIDHVHLNAFRLGLVSAAGLAAHPWSSLKDYLLPPELRREWVRAGEGLGHMGYDGEECDERLRYLEHLEQVAVRLGGRPPLPGAGRTLHSTLRRGWYLGEDSFRSELIAARRRSGAGPEGGSPVHGAEMAQRILGAGLAAAGLSYESLDNLRKSDWRKRAIGRAIRLCTTVPTEWIASSLQMGVSSRVALLVARDPEPSWGKSWRPAKELLDRLLEFARRAANPPGPGISQEEEIEKEACCAEYAAAGKRGACKCWR